MGGVANLNGAFESRPFGPYELMRRLGRGGMAEVFLARLGAGDTAKYLAIKRLHASYARNARVVARLANEAKLTVQLTHPNIVAVFDFGRLDEHYFIAMEYVDGCDLRSVIRPRGGAIGHQLPLEVALDVAYQICDALRYAHAYTDPKGRAVGVIHRDLTPHNVLVSSDGHPKLADFGIARAAFHDGLSRPGAVLGKLNYMPPEQANGLHYDSRVDLYACGTMLYEMLAGEPAFAKATRVSAASDRTPQTLSELRPMLPEEVASVVSRAMAPDPEQRFPNAESMCEAIFRLLESCGGRPKPHQLANLVRQARALEQPEKTSPGAEPPFKPIATSVAHREDFRDVETGRFRSAVARHGGKEPSRWPASKTRDDAPGGDGDDEHAVTAVRGLVTQGGDPSHEPLPGEALSARITEQSLHGGPRPLGGQASGESEVDPAEPRLFADDLKRDTSDEVEDGGGEARVLRVDASEDEADTAVVQTAAASAAGVDSAGFDSAGADSVEVDSVEAEPLEVATAGADSVEAEPLEGGGGLDEPGIDDAQTEKRRVSPSVAFHGANTMVGKVPLIPPAEVRPADGGAARRSPGSSEPSARSRGSMLGRDQNSGDRATGTLPTVPRPDAKAAPNRAPAGISELDTALSKVPTALRAVTTADVVQPSPGRRARERRGTSGVASFFLDGPRLLPLALAALVFFLLGLYLGRTSSHWKRRRLKNSERAVPGVTTKTTHPTVPAPKRPPNEIRNPGH